MKALIAVLLLSVSAAAETLTPPVAVSDAPVGAGVRSSLSPHVAENRGVFVVAWQEDDAVIIGRSEADGSFVRTASLDANIPFVRAVVRAGDGFVVVFTTDGGAAAVRLNGRGEVAGPIRLVISGYGAVVASTGRRILVVNEFGDAAMLSADAEIIRDGLHVTTAEKYTMRGAAAVASADAFLFAWISTDQRMGATLIDTDGNVRRIIDLGRVDVLGVSLDGASDGERFSVVWRSAGTLGSVQVAADGSAGPLHTFAVGPGYQVDLAWSGADYVAVLDEGSTVRRLRFNASLDVVLEQSILANESDVEHVAPQHAIANGTTVAAWSLLRHCSSEPAYIQVAVARENRGSRIVSSALADEITPAVAAGGGTPLVVWNDVREHSRMRAAVVEPAPRQISIPEEPLLDAAIATSGSGYLAAYVTLLDDCTTFLKITAFDSGGNVIGSTSIGAVTDQQALIYPRESFLPSVAWNGREYLVAWRLNREIRSVRVNAIGSILGSAVTLVQSDEEGVLTPRLAWTGQHWLLVWLRSYLPYIPLYPGPPTQNVIKARSFDGDLHPLDTPVTITERGWSPAVTTDGTRILVAWRDSSRLQAAFVDESGHASTAASAALFRDFGTSVSAAAVGGRFYVLDLDQIFVVEGAVLRPIAQLRGTVRSSAIADDITRAVIAWSGAIAGDHRRIYSSFLIPARPRRRAVR